MRWPPPGWLRFYAFRVLGTDRYPPFSLAPDPTYPADLHVDYPQRLSRGLALVKWWLLAIPHYLVVSLLAAAGWGWTWGRGDARWSVGGGGLIGLLALIAVVVLLFIGRYPPALFELIMGLNRWVERVKVYAALMRDEHPPFRLDTGGTDPGTPSPAPGTERPPPAGTPGALPR